MGTQLRRSHVVIAVTVLALGTVACGSADPTDEETTDVAPRPTGTAEDAADPQGEDPADEPTETATTEAPTVSAADLGLTCSYQPDGPYAVLEGTNTSDDPYGRLEMELLLSGPGGEVEVPSSFVVSFLPGDELAQMQPVATGDVASDQLDTCEVSSLEVPEFAPERNYDIDGSTCTVLGEETTGYWQYEVDMSGAAGFPADGDVILDVVFLDADGRRFAYQGPGLAAGETTSEDLVVHDAEPTCAVNGYTG